MTYIHNTFVRDAMCQAVIDQVDTGTGNPSGRLELQDINSSVLVTFVLQNPAFGNVFNGQAILNTVSGTVATGAGTATKAVFKNRNGTEVMTGSVTVAGAGGDFEATGMDAYISVGNVITLNQLTYNAPD